METMTADERGDVAHFELAEGGVDGAVLAVDDKERTEYRHEQHAGIDGELHDGRVEREYLFRAGEVAFDIVRFRCELFLFIVFAHICLDDSRRAHVLLHALVHGVVFFEHLGEDGLDLEGDQKQRQAHDGRDDEIDERHIDVDEEGHHDAAYEHEGRAYGDTDYHHICHLHVGNVRGHARDERRGGKFVDVSERILLYAVIHVAAQVFRKARGRRGAEFTREHAREQRRHRHDHENDAVDRDARKLHLTAAFLHVGDQIGSDEGNEHFKQHFERYHGGRQNTHGLVFADTFCQCFYHFASYAASRREKLLQGKFARVGAYLFERDEKGVQLFFAQAVFQLLFQLFCDLEIGFMHVQGFFGERYAFEPRVVLHAGAPDEIVFFHRVEQDRRRRALDIEFRLDVLLIYLTLGLEHEGDHPCLQPRGLSRGGVGRFYLIYAVAYRVVEGAYFVAYLFAAHFHLRNC